MLPLELDPPCRLFPHASCRITAVNNLLSDLFIWANSAGSLTPITLPVECLFWTASHWFTLKSILLRNQKVLPCGRPLSIPPHGTLNMLYKIRAVQGECVPACSWWSRKREFTLPILSLLVFLVLLL